jgi:hypothetical protein
MNLLVCEKNFVLYIGSSFSKGALKIGIGFRPLRSEVEMRNSFIMKLEGLAKRFEPIGEDEATEEFPPVAKPPSAPATEPPAAPAAGTPAEEPQTGNWPLETPQ